MVVDDSSINCPRCGASELEEDTTTSDPKADFIFCCSCEAVFTIEELLSPQGMRTEGEILRGNRQRTPTDVRRAARCLEVDDLLRDIRACYSELKTLSGSAPGSDLSERQARIERRLSLMRTISKRRQRIDDLEALGIAREPGVPVRAHRPLATIEGPEPTVTVFRLSGAWRFWASIDVQHSCTGPLEVDPGADEFAAMSAACQMFPGMPAIRGIDDR